MAVQELRVQVAGDEVRHVQDLLEIGDVRGHADDAEFGEGTLHALASTFAVAAPGGDLGEERVVVRRHFDAVVERAFDANARACRFAREDHAADRGQEAVKRVFRDDPAFDGPATVHQFVLFVWQLFARGHEDLVLHEVHAGRHLGYGVFDLEAGVHFEEVVAAIFSEEEFDRANVVVIGGTGEADSGAPEAAAKVRRDGYTGALFDDLLVAALDAALPFADGDDVAEAVRDDLDFDVAHVRKILLDINGRVTERDLGLLDSAGGGVRELIIAVHDTDATPAAASSSLHHHRIAYLAGDGDAFFDAVDLRTAGNHGQAGTNGDGARLDFIAKHVHGFGGGADEG